MAYLYSIDRWKGGWSTKLEGSDHAPVYMSLMEITGVAKHNTPSLSTRYFPMVRGVQQTIGARIFFPFLLFFPQFQMSMVNKCYLLLILVYLIGY